MHFSTTPCGFTGPLPVPEQIETYIEEKASLVQGIIRSSSRFYDVQLKQNLDLFKTILASCKYQLNYHHLPLWYRHIHVVVVKKALSSLLLINFVSGFGMGLMFNCAYLSVGYYFDKNRAFATALASSGTGMWYIKFFIGCQSHVKSG